MKHAEVIKRDDFYVVRVWDDGFVLMSRLIDNEWKTCIFETQEEAEQAARRYNELWGD